MIQSVRTWLRTAPGVSGAVARLKRSRFGQWLYLLKHRLRLRVSLWRQARRLVALVDDARIRGATPNDTRSVNLILDGFNHVHDEALSLRTAGAEIDNVVDQALADGAREINRRYLSGFGLKAEEPAPGPAGASMRLSLGYGQALLASLEDRAARGDGAADPGVSSGAGVSGAEADRATAEEPEAGGYREALKEARSHFTEELEASRRRQRDKYAERVEEIKRAANAAKSQQKAALAEVKAAYREQLKAARVQDRDKFKSDIAELRVMNRRLLEEFRKVPVLRYGALQSGREDWERRWDESKGRRILLYALSDYSGSFYKWAVAINRHTDYAARLVTYTTHQFGYNTDIVLPFPDVLKRSNIGKIAEEADVIHIKDESGFYLGSNNLPPDLFDAAAKPMVYTAYGGYMRKLREDARFRAYVQSFDARITMTPDLNYDWFDGYFIPHAIDSSAHAYSWSDGRTLAHSPSTKARKGTDDLIEAVEALDLDFDLIHGVSHAECVARKSKANLFFDQAGREIQRKLGVDTVIGWYGNSALEAAVFGIPTIAHLSDIAFDGAEKAGRDVRDACAIINTPLGADGIRRTLEDYFERSPDEREALAKSTRKWIEDFHSYEACADELTKVYRTLL